MRRWIAGALIALVFAGCDWGSSSSPGGGSGSNTPKPCADCTPKPIDNDIAKMSADIVNQVHDELLATEQQANVSPIDWQKLSGWKLLTILRRHVTLADDALEDAKNARLFYRLHQELHDDNGQVKSTIDAQAVIQDLVQEYFKL